MKYKNKKKFKKIFKKFKKLMKKKINLYNEFKQK